MIIYKKERCGRGLTSFIDVYEVTKLRDACYLASSTSDKTTNEEVNQIVKFEVGTVKIGK